jgi:hypothetical protein
MAHTHLELILRYCVKTIANLSIAEALDATERDRISDLRVRIKRLFKERRPTPHEQTTLDALLGRARRLSEKRNSYLHSTWSQTAAGRAIMKNEDHRWGQAPSEAEVNQVTDEILRLVSELNDARLNGFISRVVSRHLNSSSMQSAS